MIFCSGKTCYGALMSAPQLPNGVLAVQIKELYYFLVADHCQSVLSDASTGQSTFGRDKAKFWFELLATLAEQAGFTWCRMAA